METYTYLVLGLILVALVLASLPPMRRSSKLITCHKCGKNTLEILTRDEPPDEHQRVRRLTYLRCRNAECNYSSQVEDLEEHLMEERAHR